MKHILIATLAAIVALLIRMPASLAASELVTFDGPEQKLTAVLFRPPGRGPFPAVIALHGCGGLYSTKYEGRLSQRHEDWAHRLVAAGFVVMFPDSFNPRGYTQICTTAKRPIFPRDRADDAFAALGWLAAKPYVQAKNISLLGWSHGAMSTLWTVRPDFLQPAPRFRQAFAFYPGCREIAREPGWKPTIPLTMLSGGADDWTEPGPCRRLASRVGFKFIEYPGAYHDFDAPNIKVHTLTGISSVRSGVVHVGTNAAARAAAIAEVMSALTRP